MLGFYAGLDLNPEAWVLCDLAAVHAQRERDRVARARRHDALPQLGREVQLGVVGALAQLGDHRVREGRAKAGDDVAQQVVGQRSGRGEPPHGEVDRVSQALSGRIRELAERYATPLPALNAEVEALFARVEDHLKKMGFAWH